MSSTPRIASLSTSDDGQTTGVHSLERSAQEDTLLVLFNTAISNLVRKIASLGRRHHLINASWRFFSVITLP